MKRKSDIFFKPSSIDGAIIANMFLGSAMALGFGILLFRGYLIGLVACIVVSLALLSFGLFIKFHGIYRKPDLRHLMKTGMRTTGRYVKSKAMKNLSSRADPKYVGTGQWSYPYALVLTGVNPVIGREMTFESAYVQIDPKDYVKKDDRFNVYIDPKKPDRYFVDLTPFQDRVEKFMTENEEE